MPGSYDSHQTLWGFIVVVSLSRIKPGRGLWRMAVPAPCDLGQFSQGTVAQRARRKDVKNNKDSLLPFRRCKTLYFRPVPNRSLKAVGFRPVHPPVQEMGSSKNSA